jgi:hypothetical protein
LFIRLSLSNLGEVARLASLVSDEGKRGRYFFAQSCRLSVSNTGALTVVL